MRTALLVVCILIGSFAEELPSGGQQILDGQSLHYAGSTKGSYQVKDGTHTLTSNNRGDFWNIQLLSAIKNTVTKGSLIVLRFEARCTRSEDESGCGWVTPYLQRNKTPYNKFINQRLSIPKTWKTFTLAGYADDNYASTGCALGFGAGQAVQTVEFKNISVWDYKNAHTIADIPLSKSTYQGRDQNATWRSHANKRIESIRKGQLNLEIRHSDGTPIKNMPVKIRMVRHDFPFGAALNPWRLLGTTEDDRAYQKHVLEYFNAGTFENALKWGAWDEQWGTDKWNKAQTIRTLKWCKQHNMPMRGHVIVWPSRKHLPNQLKQEQDPQKIRDAVNAHIDEITQATKGLLSEWDVVNEPFTNHDLMDICGNEIMLEWFKRMRRHLPDTQLAINDYGIITVPFDDAHVEHYYKTISYLLENRAPIDVIGIQGHFSGDPPSINRILQQLDRFADLGLKIRITEFDIDTLDEELQADFTRDLYTAAFSHPAVIGVQNWGFWSKAHWRPRAAMFRDDWSPKPNALAFKALTQEQWSTQERVSTDTRGRCSVHGFYGTYEITVDGYKPKVITHKQEQSLRLQLIKQ